VNNPAHSIAVLNCGGNANRPELSRTVPYRVVPNRTVPCSGKAPFVRVNKHLVNEQDFPPYSIWSVHPRWGCSYSSVAKNNLLKFLLKWFCFAAHDWQLLTRAAVLIQSNVMFHPHVLRHLSIPAETSFVCRALRTAIVAMLLMDGVISLDLKHKPVMFFHLNSFYNCLHAEKNWLCGTNSLDKQNKISCRVIVN